MKDALVIWFTTKKIVKKNMDTVYIKKNRPTFFRYMDLSKTFPKKLFRQLITIYHNSVVMFIQQVHSQVDLF